MDSFLSKPAEQQQQQQEQPTLKKTAKGVSEYTKMADTKEELAGISVWQAILLLNASLDNGQIQQRIPASLEDLYPAVDAMFTAVTKHADPEAALYVFSDFLHGFNQSVQLLPPQSEAAVYVAWCNGCIKALKALEQQLAKKLQNPHALQTAVLEQLELGILNGTQFPEACEKFRHLQQLRPIPNETIQIIRTRFDTFELEAAGRKHEEVELDVAEKDGLEGDLRRVRREMINLQVCVVESSLEMRINSLLISMGLNYSTLVNHSLYQKSNSWGKLNGADMQLDHFIGFRFLGILQLVPFCAVEVKAEEQPVNLALELCAVMEEGMPCTTAFMDKIRANCLNDRYIYGYLCS